MERRDLQDALTKLAAQPMPKLPANFEQGVWRKIRSRREVGVRESGWATFIAIFLRPAWAFSAVIVTLFISVGLGVLEEGSPQSRTHASLGLAVFSAEAPTLPSTLLANTR